MECHVRNVTFTLKIEHKNFGDGGMKSIKKSLSEKLSQLLTYNPSNVFACARLV